MAAESLTIWCNAKLDGPALEELKAGLAGRKLIVSDKIVSNLAAGIPDPSLAEADVAFGQPDARQVMELPRLKWVHLSSTGYARYDRPDLAEALKLRGAMLSNSSSVFAEICAQHALAMILAAARRLPDAMADQIGPRAWPAARIRNRSRLLSGQTLLIVGFGAIGRQLAELLFPLKMNLLAARRQPRGDEKIPARPMAELDGLLGGVDHLVNILPAGGGTEGFFDAARFSRLKRGAIFYNIGRGATVDQTALGQSLSAGHLGAAYLDVTTPEPLPPDDPLWTAPNCWITPHTAGGADDEFVRSVRHFLGNLARFSAGRPLVDRVF